MAPETLSIGLALLPNFQWLDAAGPVDYLNNHSHWMLSLLELPEALVNKAPIMKWHYISTDLKHVQASSGPPQLPTCTYADCPPLDLIVVPGPDPMAPAPKEFITFIKERYEDPKLRAILTVCTGSMAVAQSGIFDGKRVCSNKFVLRRMAEAGVLNKKVHWVGDRRWVVDGKVWSAAGVTAGIDLAAEYARACFDKEVVQFAQDVSEYEPNVAYPDPFARLLDGVNLA